MPVRMNEDKRPSVVLIDPKPEIGPQLFESVQAMGIHAMAINPTRKLTHILPNTNLNFWAHYYDAYYSDFPSHRRSVIPMVRNAINDLIPEPKRMDTEAGRFFIEGYKLAPEIYILTEIIDGRVPYPAGFWALVFDATGFLKWVQMIASRRNTGATIRDKIEQYAIAKAKSLLSNLQHEGLARYFEEFRSGSERYTAIYNTASHLGDYGAQGTQSLSILREKPCFLVIATPLELMNEYAPFQAHFIRALIEMAKITSGRTIHIMAEEAGTALPASVADELAVIRGLNIKIDFIFQRDQQFADKAGKDKQQALDSQIDVSIYGGVSRNDDATSKLIAERFGKSTEIISNLNTSSDGNSAASVSVDRQVKDNVLPTDVPELSRDKAFVFVSNAKGKDVKQPKFIVDKVNYGQVSPHRDGLVGFNYTENRSPLYSEKVAIDLKYEAGEAPVCLNASDPEDFKSEEVWKAEDEPFFTPYSFIWLYVLIALMATTEIFTPFSLLPF